MRFLCYNNGKEIKFHVMIKDKFKERGGEQNGITEIERGEINKINKVKIESPLEAERSAEQAPERTEAFREAEVKDNKEIAPAVGLPANSVDKIVSHEKKEREKEIEKILEKNLSDIYISLPPNKQQEFKVSGERAAQEINNLLDRAKVKVKQIIAVIKKWLSFLPGVNRFFIEQEAKIKADEIMRLKEDGRQ